MAGPSGLRQVDAAACARLRRHADQRRGALRAARRRRAARSRAQPAAAARIGFVFQRFFLLPMLTACENVELPQAEAGVGKAERRERTRELLDYVGLAERSGSSAVAALRRRDAARRDRPRAGQPAARCCSPTSRPASWTRRPATQIVALFDRVHAEGTAVVVVTHDPAVAAQAHRLVSDARRAGGRGHDAMILRLALRSLLAHPIRSAVLAAGFGLGIGGDGGAARRRRRDPRAGARAGAGRRRRRRDRRPVRSARQRAVRHRACSRPARSPSRVAVASPTVRVEPLSDRQRRLDTGARPGRGAEPRAGAARPGDA